jgi:hypothetical protein
MQDASASSDNAELEHMVGRLRQLDAGFEDAFRSCLAYWSPECPPPTTLFGEFGRAFGRMLRSETTREQLGPIFFLIEEMMRSQVRLVGECAATGFLESLFAEIYDEPHLVECVEKMMLEESRAHWDGWKSFGS